MANMACTITETRVGSVKKIKFDWLSDDSAGTVAGTTTYAYSGRFIGLITVPSGVTAPDNLYDITLVDGDGVDLLLGAGLNRSNVNTEFVVEAAMAGVSHSKLTIAIAAAGNAKLGIAYLLIR